MKIADIPSTKFPIPFADAAGSGYIRPIPEASQIGITNGAASLTDGFPPLNFLPVGSGGIPPFGQDFNGILNEISAWTRWQNSGGLTLYDSAFSTAIGGYPKGAILASATAGVVWLCTADDNTTNPDAGGANWVSFSNQSGVSNYAVAAGTATTITASLSPAPTALTNGLTVNLLLTATITGPATLNLNGLGATPIKTPYLNSLAANDAVVGQTIKLVYSSGAFVISPSDVLHHGVTVYDAAGTFTFTAPVTGWYWVDVYGGGGAYASFTGNTQGEGGGGGGYSGKWVFHTAGDTTTVTVGAAGSAGGANGGTSSYGSSHSATGGGTATASGTNGAGGTGTGGQINQTGQAGADGNASGLWAGFGGDAAGPNGGKGAMSANGGTWPGGGGGLLSYTGSIIWVGGPVNGGVVIRY